MKIGTKVEVISEFKVFNTKNSVYIINPNKQGIITSVHKSGSFLVNIDPIGEYWYQPEELKVIT